MKKIEAIGDVVPTAKIELAITGMTCANCVRAVERTLLKKTPGIVTAQVNFATEKASIEYLPHQVSPNDMRLAIKRAGYGAETVEKPEQIVDQSHKFWIGVIFTLPVFILSMNRDFGEYVDWLILVMTLPVQFYVGWDYYVGSWKSLKNGAANMDVLVAMGTSVAFFYSLAVLLNPAFGEHIYFETAAMMKMMRVHSVPIY
ncbi:copper-translocating P-type ATPase [Candidatus Thiomargarita nelsonii]|uniref:Copper-translocating P-type ATPase n=1 Tax=Candidatus Thiomargarita nelsonii TaxID=1003181 RepID=A0A0A6P0L2_9GAMM|nr:copper-translocating P-type ATPase [Candidatus Thiomargarita nelsonii]